MTDPIPLDDVEFLARSSHRVAVLQVLRSGPWTRPDLHDETGISQPTLGRVIGSLQDRSWVEQEGRLYTLTPMGTLVTDAFVDLLDIFGTFHRLGDVIGLLPTDRMDFDLGLFGESTVSVPEDGDKFGHLRRVDELVYGSDDVRMLSPTMAPGTDEEQAEHAAAILESNRRFEVVFTADVIDKVLATPLLEDPRFVEHYTAFLASERVRLFRYEGTFPLVAGVADSIAFLVPMNDQGHPAAVVETTDSTIRTWVEDLIDDYRSDSVELTVNDLSP